MNFETVPDCFLNEEEGFHVIRFDFESHITRDSKQSDLYCTLEFPETIPTWFAFKQQGDFITWVYTPIDKGGFRQSTALLHDKEYPNFFKNRFNGGISGNVYETTNGKFVSIVEFYCAVYQILSAYFNED